MTGDSVGTHARIVAEQRALWGTAPRDWSELAERENTPLFEAVLDAARIAPGGRLLDVGCGSGLLCAIAAGRGAAVTGIDVTPELLAVARERLPSGHFQEGDMSSLPFAPAAFDAVTGVNSFQFAPDPAQALAEAARVLRPGGRLVVALFTEPERSEGTAMHLAMKGLIEEAEGQEDGYAPYALSSEPGLRQVLDDAGFKVTDVATVPLAWRYRDREETLRSLFASAGGARAIRAAGRERVRDALLRAMAPFTGADGEVTFHNEFRYAVARHRR